MDFEKLLKLVTEKEASDLFITAGKPPSMKINGKLYAAGKNALSPDEARDVVLGVMSREQQEVFLLSLIHI